MFVLKIQLFLPSTNAGSDPHWSSTSRYTTANNSYVPPPDVTDPTLLGVMGEKQPMIHVGADAAQRKPSKPRQNLPHMVESVHVCCVHRVAPLVWH